MNISLKVPNVTQIFSLFPNLYTDLPVQEDIQVGDGLPKHSPIFFSNFVGLAILHISVGTKISLYVPTFKYLRTYFYECIHVYIIFMRLALHMPTHQCIYCVARQCLPLGRKFMECYIIKPAQSLLMKHLVTGQR